MRVRNGPLLEVKDLKVYYEVGSSPIRAVDSVTFEVSEHEILSIAGESGSGKTTLANALIRIIPPPGHIAGGKVFLQGKDLLELTEEEFRNVRWKEISILPQSAMNALNPVMKIHDQIKETVEAHDSKIPENGFREFLETLLNSVALPPYVAKSYPCQLSGGMRQRAILAMAMALRPRLLIADEPTSALDVVTQRKVLELLAEQKEKGTSVMLITHDVAVSAQIADRMAIMYAGKIVEIGNVSDVFHEPLHSYTQKLIDSVPSLRKRKTLEGLKGLPPDLRNPPAGCRFEPRCPHSNGFCKKGEPELRQVKPGHYVDCHLCEMK